MAIMSSIRKEPSLGLVAATTGVRAANSKSVLAADLAISGHLASKGEVEINGWVDGNIDCHSLIIGRGAQVRGTIVADSLQVHGAFDGQAQAETLSISRTARVTGEILHGSLTIESGAFIEARTQSFIEQDVESVNLTPPPSEQSEEPPALEPEENWPERKAASA